MTEPTGNSFCNHMTEKHGQNCLNTVADAFRVKFWLLNLNKNADKYVHNTRQLFSESAVVITEHWTHHSMWLHDTHLILVPQQGSKQGNRMQTSGTLPTPYPVKFSHIWINWQPFEQKEQPTLLVCLRRFCWNSSHTVHGVRYMFRRLCINISNIFRTETVFIFLPNTFFFNCQ